MDMRVYTIKTTHIFFKNNIYLIIDEKSKKAAVVDPVWDKDKILNFLHQRGLTLSAILLTHAHPDHVHLADTLARTTGSDVYMSQIEIEFYGFDCYNLVPLHGDDHITLGNTIITPIHTPGHTKGSLCYMTHGHIFTGDTLFVEGCGLCWGKGADPSELYDTLQLLKKIIPPDMKVHPGHTYMEEPGVSFEHVLNYNIYLDFKTKESFIKYRMRKNQKLLFAFK